MTYQTPFCSSSFPHPNSLLERRELGVLLHPARAEAIPSAARHSAGLGAANREGGLSVRRRPVTTAAHFPNTRRTAHTRPPVPQAPQIGYVLDGYRGLFSGRKS